MNSKIIIFLAVATFVYGEQICTPNSVFKQYCNTCHCSEDGTVAACTKMYCDKTVFNPDGTFRPHITFYKETGAQVNEEKAKVCTPNSVFKVECNYCSCLRDGTGAACTMMICPQNIVIPDNIITKPNEIPALEEPKCTPGKTFKHYCNTCYCSKDGSPAACTKMYCDPRIFNPDGSLKDVDTTPIPEVEKVCEPGNVFKRDCNTCVCSDDGTSEFCTYKDCGSQEEQSSEVEKACEPGQVFTRECNTCICGLEGTEAMCTLRDCDGLRGSVWNYLGSVEKKCVPGKAFKQDCNHCRCSRDGTSAICTLLNCGNDRL